MTTAVQALTRRAVILGHLSQDPGRALTSYELARVAGRTGGSISKVLRTMEQHGEIVADTGWRRQVSLWRIAPPGTVPPPPVPLPPERLAARRKRDREYQRSVRARLREQQHPSSRPVRRECYAAVVASGQKLGIRGGVNFEEAHRVSALPCPHTRNDCGMCRERDADFEVVVADPVVGERMSLLCQRCLGPWFVTQVYLLDGRAAMTLAWAPGRLAGHGLTGGDSR